jgi:hypothetical protein
MPKLHPAIARSVPHGLCLLVWVVGLIVLLSDSNLRSLAPQGGTFTAPVRVANNMPLRRREWALATVPFPQGVWTAGKTFGVRNVRSELVPFGARWADGSVRFAQLAVLADLAPLSQGTYVVEEVVPPTPTFRYSPWTQARINSFSLEIQVGRPDGTVARANITPFAVLEDTPVRKTTQYRGRLPNTQLVYDVWITHFADSDLAHFEFRLTSSMVGGPEWIDAIDWLVIVPTGATPFIRGRDRLGVVQPGYEPTGANPVLLLGPTSMFDGQAYEWWGNLMFLDPNIPLADAQIRRETVVAAWVEPLFGVAQNWKASNAFGPFGYLPDPPYWLTDRGVAAVLDDWASFQSWQSTSGQSWEDRPMGLLPYAAATGNQHDFGIHKLEDVFISGVPHGVEEARFMAGEEAHRPVHFREADGSPLQSANHPNFITRGGRVHWSTSVSPDRLGKPQPEVSPSGRTHGWTGKDLEHWSSLTLSSAYLLTRSWSLREELETEAEMYLSSQTVPSIHGNLPTNNIDNGRAVGRSFLSMSWNWVCTGRNDLIERMRRRVDECVVPQHYGLANGGTVRPLTVKAPDSRTIGTGQNWSPWEEALAVAGLAAFVEISGHTNAENIAWEIGRNLIHHGWKVDFDDTLIGYAIRYLPGGAPLPPGAATSTEYARWPSSPEAFNIWALPATRLTLTWALQRNDTATASRAALIEAATEALRRPARSGPPDWDAFASWDLR